MKKKKIGVAVITVPILAAGSVALAASYRSELNYQPGDTKQDIQVNQVVFDGDDGGTGHQKKKSNDDSHLLQKNKKDQADESTQVKDQGDYLFENEQLHTESVGILDDTESSASDSSQTQKQDDAQPDQVYNVTKDASKADTSLSTPQGSTGQNTNTSGNSSSDKQSGGTSNKKKNTTSSGKQNTEKNDSSSGQTGTDGNNNSGSNSSSNNNQNSGNNSNGNNNSSNNGNNNSNNGNNNNNGNTTRPAESAKDPESEKTDPPQDHVWGVTNKPYIDGLTPGQDTDENGNNKSIIIAQSSYENGNGLYEGQSVDKNVIYNALDTWVYGKDGVRYLWRADALDKYVRIDGVSFDGGKTWNTSFPVTIPENLEEGQMLIRTFYRLSVNESEWVERQVSYIPYKNRIFVLTKKLQEENQVIGTGDILNTDQHPETGSKLNLLMTQRNLLGEEELTELFPGWTENGQIVPWFYPVTKGRHILEPADGIPLASGYKLSLKPQWMTEDLEIDYNGTLCYLQTLTDFTEDVLSGDKEQKSLSVPKYIQAVDFSSDMDADVDYLELSDTVLYYNENQQGVRVVKGYKVNVENLNYSSTEDGILADKTQTVYMGVPCEIETLTVPENVHKVILTANNNLSTLELKAKIYDELPEITYANLKNCKTVIKDDLLLTFIENNYKELSEGKGNTVASEEEPEVTYTVKNEGIVNNQGELRRIIKTGRHNFRLPSEVNTIQSGAFDEVSGLTTVVLPQNGKEITLEENCFAGSDVNMIRCYSENQYQSVKDQIEKSGAASDVTIELISKSVEGIGYVRSETEGVESITVIDVPDTITSFDGTLTSTEGELLEVTSIGDNAFENCKALEWVDLPECVKSIGYQAFRNCNSLEWIFIRSTDRIYIGNASIEGCDSLRFLASNAMEGEMQDGYAPVVKDAQGNMFFYVPTGSDGYGGTSLAFDDASGVSSYDLVDIGDGKRMLYGCDENGEPWLGLRSAGNVSDQVTLPATTIELFSGALEQTHSPSGNYTVNWNDLTSLWVLDNDSFRNSDVGGEINLVGTPAPFANYLVSNYVFYGCRNIQTVNIAQDDYRLEDASFGSCTSLTTVVTGGSSYSSIFTGAFTGCDNLTDLTFGCTYPLSLVCYANSEFRFNYDWTQEEAAKKLHIHVPEGSEMTYVKGWRYLFCGYADLWSKTAYMSMWDDIENQNIDWTTGMLPSDETVMELLESKLLATENALRTMLGMDTVSEPADMYHYHFDENTWQLTLLRVPSNLESLDLGYVLDMGFPFNMDITYIGSNAFVKSPNIKEINIPATLSGIQENAFAGINSDKLELNFDDVFWPGDELTIPELIRTDTSQPFSFGIDDSRISINVPYGREDEYIEAWRCAFAGYADEDAVRQEVVEKLNATDPDKTPTEDEINLEVEKKLLPAENRIRVMMGLDPVDEADLETNAEEDKESEEKDTEAEEVLEADIDVETDNSEENADQESQAGEEIIVDQQESPSDASDDSNVVESSEGVQTEQPDATADPDNTENSDHAEGSDNTGKSENTDTTEGTDTAVGTTDSARISDQGGEEKQK